MKTDITIHTEWCEALRTECEKAEFMITVSAISLQPPQSTGTTPWKKLWRAWEHAAARGVAVRFFLPEPSNAHPATKANTRAAIIAQKAGMFVYWVAQPRLLHAKTITIDNNACWIGSGNMTAAAAHHNHEMYVRFNSPQAATKIVEWLRKIAQI